jgi:ATP-dependent RNA helicase SUPV3L1/SUV3
MGLNLSIKRVVFYSLKKPQTKDTTNNNNNNNNSTTNTNIPNATNIKENQDDRRDSIIDYLSTSQALQIAGRAGRFNTMYEDGFVTTFHKQDLNILLSILKNPLERIKKAGLHPTADQIELFAYQLPNNSLSNLIQIFMSICKIDNGQYFLCNFEEIKNLAEMIDHIPIPLKAKYTFCTSPISTRDIFVSSCFVKFVRSYSNNEPVTVECLQSIINWKLSTPTNLNELLHLESVFDTLDLYLWLSFRFPTIFSQPNEIAQMRIDLEMVIFKGIKQLLSKSSKSNNQITRSSTNYNNQEQSLPKETNNNNNNTNKININNNNNNKIENTSKLNSLLNKMSLKNLNENGESLSIQPALAK